MNYNESNRGKPQYKDRMKQLINFDGLRFNGNITPTDIDGFFEVHGEVFVFFEVKLEGASLPHGQSLALRRIVDYLHIAGREAVLFVCTHKINNCTQEITAKDLRVSKVYYKGKVISWDGRTLKESVDAFLEQSRKKFEL